MGKPRMIILIRHAQSEGNKNRDIHQMIPDHRVKLTNDGWKQAEEAGHRLRSMLKPDDTIQFFTSPYRRTRETTEGILSSLTSDSEEHGPSPFPRHTIKVFEEPRLREQDFGNFQPCSSEMERMWQERADYGHFFYRIPNGESAADAYDRVSGFNESLWRNFSEEDFPSVCVLVTHGLMTRVFLMKWYHWSVEYFEDLRNVNHCEFVVMKKNLDNGKYILQNQLRTWSELKKRAIAQDPNASSLQTSPTVPARKWGGCVGGCNHEHSQFPRRVKAEQAQKNALTPSAAVQRISQDEKDDHPIGTQNVSTTTPKPPSITSAEPDSPPQSRIPVRPSFPRGRDGGGSLSGLVTPAEGLSDMSGGESDYFTALKGLRISNAPPKRSVQKRRPTFQDLEDWAKQSGMGSGAKADPLGDNEHDDEDEGDGDDEEEHEHDHDGVNLNEPSKIIERLQKQEKDDKSLRGSVY